MGKVYCESIEKGVAKTGNEFLKLGCRTTEKKFVQFYLWDQVADFMNLYSAGHRVFDCMFGGDANFPKITSFEPCEGDVTEFYTFIYQSDDYSGKVLDSLIGAVHDGFYSLLIHKIFSSKGPDGYSTVYDAFKVIPAAKAYHHDYRYGLVQHTQEVMSFVMRVSDAPLFQADLDKELLLTGALLHDVGKVYEYAFDGCNHAEYGTGLDINQIYLGSHLYKGAEMVALSYSELCHADPSIKTQMNDLRVEHLKHIILSHHLQRDWGAVPKAPQTLEAYLVFLADYFSAAYGKFKAIDWSGVTAKSFMGSTSKYDTFFGFNPLLESMQSQPTESGDGLMV